MARPSSKCVLCGRPLWGSDLFSPPALFAILLEGAGWAEKTDSWFLDFISLVDDDLIAQNVYRILHLPQPDIIDHTA